MSSSLHAEANRAKLSFESTTGWYPESLGAAPQLNNFFTSFEDLENSLVLIQKPVVASSMACEGSWSYMTSVPIAHEDTNSALPERHRSCLFLPELGSQCWPVCLCMRHTSPSSLHFESRCCFSLVYWGLICWTASVSLQTEVGCWPALKSSLKTWKILYWHIKGTMCTPAELETRGSFLGSWATTLHSAGVCNHH